MSERQSIAKPTAAFVLSLLAGLWMLITGGMMYGWGPGMMGDWWEPDGMSGWMWGHGMMRGWAPIFWWPWFGIVAGIVVLIGAAMLYAKPEQSKVWGITILVVSALNFFLGMGGFIAGVLGIIGGALAIGWRSQTQA